VSKRTQSDLKTKSKSESVISAGAQLTLFGQPAVTSRRRRRCLWRVSRPYPRRSGLNFKWPATARSPPPEATTSAMKFHRWCRSGLPMRWGRSLMTLTQMRATCRI